MRHLLWILLIAGCTESPTAPLSSATLSSDATVRTARAKGEFVSYGNPYHRWTITLGTIEGCAGDTIAGLEVTTLSGVTDLPLGAHAIRTTEMPATVPSAFVRYGANTPISGTLTIETVNPTFITGSLDAMIMIAGTPTQVTADFGAPVCP